jgi:hypothetical protein
MRESVLGDTDWSLRVDEMKAGVRVIITAGNGANGKNWVVARAENSEGEIVHQIRGRTIEEVQELMAVVLRFDPTL